MEGSKTLQDLFTDAGVPRTDRGRVPVVVSGEEVVWVAGLAVAHRHRLRPETATAVRLSAART
jgi:tRNA(Ile)-lysidine synthase